MSKGGSRFPFPQGLDFEAVLHTERLWLEPIRKDHAREMFALWQDREIYTFVPEEPPSSLGWLEARYERLMTRQSPEGDEAWLQWVLRRREDRLPLGRLEASVRLDGTAQVAWMLGTAYARQGYAREAMAGLITHLRDDFKVRELQAEIDSRNARSLRLAEALGFARTAFVANADHFKGAASDEWQLRLRL